MRDAGEKSVVISFPSAQPVPVTVESHSRNDGYVNGSVVCKYLSDGFHNAKGSFLQVGYICVAAQLHIGIARDVGQQHSLALCCQLVKQWLCLHFIGQGTI